MEQDQKNCIFCQELLPSDSEECPECGKKPFSGMYFDPKTYTLAEELEKNGELVKAWETLHEEWVQHGDMDYYDDEMFFELLQKLNELYERNPILIRQRINLTKEHWRKIVSHSHFPGTQEIEEGLDIARKANRKDLEEELIMYLDELHRR